MICKICNEEHNLQSGTFTKHIKNKHNLDKQEYYYLFHKKTECSICGENREVKTWKFDLLETCPSKDCKETNRRNKISKSQLQKTKDGTHQFQNKKLREQLSVNLREKAKKGEHPFQDKDTREKALSNMKKTFLLTNPMKKDEVRLKLSKAHKGKKLSMEHKEAISIGLSKYLSNLSDDAFYARMINSEYQVTPIDMILKRSGQHIYECEKDYSNYNWDKLNEAVFGNSKPRYSEHEIYKMEGHRNFMQRERLDI